MVGQSKILQNPSHELRQSRSRCARVYCREAHEPQEKLPFLRYARLNHPRLLQESETFRVKVVCGLRLYSCEYFGLHLSFCEQKLLLIRRGCGRRPWQRCELRRGFREAGSERGPTACLEIDSYYWPYISGCLRNSQSLNFGSRTRLFHASWPFLSFTVV